MSESDNSGAPQAAELQRGLISQTQRGAAPTRSVRPTWDQISQTAGCTPEAPARERVRGCSERDARLPSRSGTPRLARSGTTLLRTRWVLLSGDRGALARSSATRFAAEHPARGRAARWRRAKSALVTIDHPNQHQVRIRLL